VSAIDRRLRWLRAHRIATSALLAVLALLALLSASDRTAMSAPAPSPRSVEQPSSPGDRAVVHHAASVRSHATVASPARLAWLSTTSWDPEGTPPVARVGDRMLQAFRASLAYRPSSRGPPR
jgi:hypothetical protein